LESLRLENLPGITDAGLSQYTSRPESLSLRTHQCVIIKGVFVEGGNAKVSQRGKKVEHAQGDAGLSWESGSFPNVRVSKLPHLVDEPGDNDALWLERLSSKESLLKEVMQRFRNEGRRLNMRKEMLGSNAPCPRVMTPVLGVWVLPKCSSF
jgi:hypothetical protein